MRSSSRLAVLLLCAPMSLLSCGGSRSADRSAGRPGDAASPSLAAPPAPPGSPAPLAPQRPRPRLSRLTEALFVSCTSAEPGKPCGFNAMDVAADGTILVGGGNYGAVLIGGKRHPKAAFESLLLGAFDKGGRGLWSVSKGTQWHNNVKDILILGDTVFITGVHANGFEWGPWKFPRKAPPPNADFEAEVGFVAALRVDGTPLWAKNLDNVIHGSDVRSTTTKVWASAFLGSRDIAPDGHGGIWVPAREEGPEVAGTPRLAKLWLTHIAADGSVIEKREVDLSGLTLMGGKVAAVAPDGVLHCLATKGGKPFLVGIDAKGSRTEAPLPELTGYPAILVLTAKGEAYAILSGDWNRPVDHVVSYFARSSDAAPRWTRSVHEPFTVPAVKAEHNRLRAATYDEVSGELILALTHMEPLRIDGLELPATSLIVSGSTPTGMTATVRMRSDGSVSSVGTFAEPYCIRHYPSGTVELFAAHGSLFMRAGILSVADLKGCMPAEPVGGLFVRIEERPAEGPR